MMVLYLLAALVFLTVAWIWVSEFVQLMLLGERDFFGPHDKHIWAAAFIFLFFLAPFAFRAWRQAARASRVDEPPIRVEFPGED